MYKIYKTAQTKYNIWQNFTRFALKIG